MFHFIYIEKEIETHPRVQKIVRRFSKAQKVVIEKYGEVFNRVKQNFRLQKQKPSLILAKKNQNFVLKIPQGYGIGSIHNYYFSHLLNCPYDCRYCFLQGMYASAHYVYFVNLEDFQKEIVLKMADSTTFFSGYDCDSLAMESVTEFAETFLPFIACSKANFEFRTKSVNIGPFLNREPLSNCIISWTLSPTSIQKDLEHRTPSIEKRLCAMQKLQKRGWLLGIRFDPLVECPNGKEVYSAFFKTVFYTLRLESIHSITLGVFRTPKPIFKKMVALYPDEALFSRGLEEKDQLIGLKNQSLLSFCQQEVLKYIPKDKLFITHAF